MKTDIPDGFYAVVNPKFVAAFEVEHGQVTLCAPILKARWNPGYWRRRGQLRRIR